MIVLVKNLLSQTCWTYKHDARLTRLFINHNQLLLLERMNTESRTERACVFSTVMSGSVQLWACRNENDDSPAENFIGYPTKSPLFHEPSFLFCSEMHTCGAGQGISPVFHYFSALCRVVYDGKRTGLDQSSCIVKQLFSATMVCETMIQAIGIGSVSTIITQVKGVFCLSCVSPLCLKLEP